MIRLALRRIAAGIVILVAISYVSLLAQNFAMRTRRNLPAPLGEVTQEALRATIQVWKGLPRGDLGDYRPPGYEYSRPEAVPLAEVMGRYLINSLGLLLLATALAGIVGALIGILAAPNALAAVCLASSNALLALCPNMCTLEAFPIVSEKEGSMASSASRRTGLVAAWSR